MVDTEFKKNLSNQDKRIYQLVKSAIVNPGCQLSRFGTGNLESLKVDNIRERVIKFYKEKYSANLMNVALAGEQSLDALQAMAERHFGSI
jgi:secreted Zn-dependent insulinase-like peptidase